MLEIILIIAVVKAFRSVAKEKGLNSGFWAFIGAASYYGPVLIMSFVGTPMLYANGVLTATSEGQVMFTAVILNLIAGVLCCFFAYQYLKSLESEKERYNDILDAE